jgi:hypothetical protein
MSGSRWSALGLVALAAALVAAGCSSSKNPHAFNATGGANGTGGSGGGGGAGGSTPDAGGGHCAKTSRPTNDAFCYTKTCNPAPDCSRVKEGPVDDCCVLTANPPTTPLVRTTDTKKYNDPTGKPPDISCFDPAHYPPKPPSGAPPLVTIQGKVTAFANGCDMTGVKIAVYKVQRTGDPATDGQLGQLVGTPVVTDTNSPVVEETVSKCTDPRKDRQYTYPGVPMYTELVIETSANAASDPWSPLYTYNIYIAPDDPDYDQSAKTYSYDPEALAASDFQTIPNVAGINNITAGNGAIGGEIHDCGNIRLQNASVGVSAPARALVYFDDDEDDPLPDTSRIGTGKTALYAALDMAPGFVRMSADGYLNGKLVSLGYYDVRVFPNSVTAVSLQGLRPFQEQ